jgi:hypothetical protein
MQSSRLPETAHRLEKGGRGRYSRERRTWRQSRKTTVRGGRDADSNQGDEVRDGGLSLHRRQRRAALGQQEDDASCTL